MRTDSFIEADAVATTPDPVDPGAVVKPWMDVYGRLVLGAKDAIAEVVLTLDTDAYASGDVLADTQEIPDAFFRYGTTILQSITVLDNDDQAGAFDLVFLRSNTSIGTENIALNIADGDADEILTVVEISASDYIDLANSQIAMKNVSDVGLAIVMQPINNTDTSLYVAAISRDTKTYSANGLKIKIGLIRN